jgi:hypothetical protein
LSLIELKKLPENRKTWPYTSALTTGFFTLRKSVLVFLHSQRLRYQEYGCGSLRKQTNILLFIGLLFKSTKCLSQSNLHLTDSFSVHSLPKPTRLLARKKADKHSKYELSISTNQDIYKFHYLYSLHETTVIANPKTKDEY